MQALKNVGDISTTTFQLQYIHDQFTTSENFDDISRHCPHVLSIFLDTPDSAVLPKLQQFKKLKKLKFNKVTFELLLETLKTIPYHISQIELVTSQGSLDLSLLSQLCPNLQTLEVYYSKNILSKGPVQFNKLRKCIIYSTELTGQASSDLLASCPNIEHLNLSSAKTIDHTHLMKIVLDGQLVHVTELAIMSAPMLDIHAVDLLVTSLPRLRLLGRLQGWNVTASQVEERRKTFKKQNYDILLWFNLPMHLELNFDEGLDDIME